MQNYQNFESKKPKRNQNYLYHTIIKREFLTKFFHILMIIFESKSYI